MEILQEKADKAKKEYLEEMARVKSENAKAVEQIATLTKEKEEQ